MATGAGSLRSRAMNSPDVLLLANAAATLFMVGVIVFVDRVHYPMFDRYGREDYAATQRMHERRTSWVVGPPMLAELLTGVALPFALPRGVPAWQAWLGVALIAGWFASTALWQVPAHRTLDGGFDPIAHRRLVSTNRWRTLAWLARASLVLAMLAERLSSS